MQFDDANLHQTWPVGVARWGTDNLEHAIVHYDEDIIGASQVRVKPLPFLGTSIAYISWGPMWRRGDKTEEYDFRNVVGALRHHYVQERGYFLVMMPTDFGHTSFLNSTLAALDFKPVHNTEKYKSLGLDLSLSLDELRAGLGKDWSRNLKRANRNKFTLQESSDKLALEEFFSIYDQMMALKKFGDVSLIGSFREFQHGLPETLKLRVFVSKFEGEPVATIAVWVANGRATRHFAATTPEGRSLGAAFWLDWQVVQALHYEGLFFYDLCGINPENNPGVFHYKKGLAGSNAATIDFPGLFCTWQNPFGWLIFRLGFALRNLWRRYSF